MELGLDELSPRFYSYQTTTVLGQPFTQSGFFTYDAVCKSFVYATYNGAISPDRFMKERISFVELTFRLREEELTASKLELAKMIEDEKRKEPPYPVEALDIASRHMTLGSRAYRKKMLDETIANNESRNAVFAANVDELNERFKQAGTQLNYHNGFIQIATDPLVQEQIERAFWEVVANPMWKNVDIDMKEALDRRDANDRDPAFYSARALESAIKIISNEKGWTHGGEKGAHSALRADFGNIRPFFRGRLVVRLMYRCPV